MQKKYLKRKKIMKNVNCRSTDSRNRNQRRSWYTGEGKNIATTIILYPKCRIDKLTNLSIEIAEKIKEAIYELYGYELKIKSQMIYYLITKNMWYFNRNTLTRRKYRILLISFGFNVNEDNFSEETKDIATS